jgi:hypothetical protein
MTTSSTSFPLDYMNRQLKFETHFEFEILTTTMKLFMTNFMAFLVKYMLLVFSHLNMYGMLMK